MLCHYTTPSLFVARTDITNVWSLKFFYLGLALKGSFGADLTIETSLSKLPWGSPFYIDKELFMEASSTEDWDTYKMWFS